MPFPYPYHERMMKYFSLPVVLALIAVGVAAGGLAYFNMRPAGELMMAKGDDMMQKGEALMQKGDDMLTEGEAMKQEGEEMMGGSATGGTAPQEQKEQTYAGARLAGGASPLLDFTRADYEQAVASDKLVVLYFYANWCPNCKAEFPKMQAAFNALERDDVVGFRVNYNDNQTDADEKALARELGVAYQHTKVFLKNGERVLKSPESWEEARYHKEIETATR
jgi:thiol-disulfide isomerase/thioredoxin